jgi:hypothetical protein
MTTSRSVTSPVLGLGLMLRQHWKDLAPSSSAHPRPEDESVVAVESSDGLVED